MKRENITKADEVTKDIVPGEAVEETFNFPTLGVSVKAKSMNEALIKAKDAIKGKNNE